MNEIIPRDQPTRASEAGRRLCARRTAMWRCPVAARPRTRGPHPARRGPPFICKLRLALTPLEAMIAPIPEAAACPDPILSRDNSQHRTRDRQSTKEVIQLLELS
jgi:hypothetical protein